MRPVTSTTKQNGMSRIAQLFAVGGILLLCRAPTVSANMCTRTEMREEPRTRTVWRDQTEYYWGKCPRFGGIYYKPCQKTRTVKRPQTERYMLQVATEVEDCCAGYKKSWQFGPVCLPDCDNLDGCTNGACVAPDTCLCDTDYELNDAGRCQPMCGDCENGQCNRPYVCECNDGYMADEDENKCAPVCQMECENGYCMEPDKCGCHEGYTAHDENRCEPVCEQGCPNGECIAPNHCECSHGYYANDDRCHPLCEPGCTNGDCVAPDQCECHDGYVASSSGGSQECVPHCESGCADNEHCVAPGQCECADGYEMDAELGNHCSPVCVPGCLNGDCVAPNECHCHAGFSRHWETGFCQPDCEPACNDHGTCVAPQLCQCADGYRLAANSTTNCVAHCEPACMMAACAAPNRCECHDAHEFEADSMHRCQPKCEPACQHGRCVAPDRCECDAGYAPAVDAGHEEHRWQCVPQCAKGACRNGHCVAPPDQCACNVGYGLRPTAANSTAVGSTECVALCEPSCGVAALCVAPGICACAAGFAAETPDQQCRPVCRQPCANGQCAAPDRCACLPGFRPHNDTACLPDATTTEISVTKTASQPADIENASRAPFKSHSQQPCVPYCAGADSDANLCVLCAERHGLAAVCNLRLKDASGQVQHIPLDDSAGAANDNGLAISAALATEICHCRQASVTTTTTTTTTTAIYDTTSTDVAEATSQATATNVDDHCAAGGLIAVHGARLNCSLTGCVGGSCEAISGVCQCLEGYEEAVSSGDVSAATAYRCVAMNSSSRSNDEWSSSKTSSAAKEDVSDRSWLTAILLTALIVAAALIGAMYGVYYRRRSTNAIYPRDDFIAENSSM